ncbi:MAG: polysaccharide biosynthesis tyrosine autokinase [Oenococcus sp.]|uniref:polysaccharide biosynthesis tyrosine autokinase n=1 Tax=Oenococcus TaxID=46254 RepID=UPI0021E76314|nr:polysaccharide biosynthesis tyrosine autokinase [Oenococcus kitaharae]MCV3296562.1 polysaccharide biosynthesis tyrosine autokinase [Oenococcus kitaharae]
MSSRRKNPKISAIDLRSSRYGVPLVTVQDPDNVVSEQFRVLRANIDFAASSAGKEFKTVLFTSSEMSDGKSTVAENCAVAWAQVGKRVLLLDVDFRRPVVHQTFNVSNDHGLSSVLVLGDQPAQTIHTTSTPNLYIMTSGPMPPNPSGLLASDKMLQVLEWMKSQFDLVVLDGTPLLAVPDAQSLIPRTDGVVLVALLGKTKKRNLVSATHILKLAKANILGLVSRSRERSDRGYGYEYAYGYDSTNKLTDPKLDEAAQPQAATAIPAVKAPVTSQMTAENKPVAEPPANIWTSYDDTKENKSVHSDDQLTNKPKTESDFVPLVDIHSHILPNLDDGPQSMEASLRLAKEAVENGIETIVATPHQLDGRWSNSPEKVLSAVVALIKALKEADINLKVLAGQEAFLSSNLLAAFDQGKILTIADTKKYLLLELPERHIPSITHAIVTQLKQQGVTVIIAHPERNEEILANPKKLNLLAQKGALFQVNSSSINGAFGKRIADFSIDLLRRGFATTIASDTKDFSVKIPYQLADAYATANRIIGSQRIKMLRQNAVRIISGLPVDSVAVEEF